jgi:hypothetical protein
MTQQERIWWQIKASGVPIGVHGIADALGIDCALVRKAMWYIRRRCAVATTGRGTAMKYSIPAGETYKCLGRGNHPNSRMQLQPWHWQNGLAAIQEKKIAGHSGTKSIPKPKPQIALEQFWPSMITRR